MIDYFQVNMNDSFFLYCIYTRKITLILGIIVKKLEGNNLCGMTQSVRNSPVKIQGKHKFKLKNIISMNNLQCSMICFHFQNVT